jgi:uncharacterized protein (TIGR01777 family)
MRILISGSTGFIGTAVVSALHHGGDEVIRLVRTNYSGGDPHVTWDIDKGTIDQASLEGMDGVIHLAGENIGEGRWTSAKKTRIRDSRVKGTSLLCNSLSRCERKPRVVLSASATGIYGNRGDELLDETSAHGTGFLADVCKEWENATQPLRDAGVRVVQLRTAVVLSGSGGALAKMLTPFKMGAGGVVGPGTQYMSWIDIDDMVRALLFLMDNESVDGAYNLAAPNPVTNKDMTKKLARAVHRPAVFPMPAVALRALLGEMADALLLSSARVYPKRLLEAGFEFEYPELEQCLRHHIPRRGRKS